VSQFITLLALGLGLGGIYTLLAQGLLVIYRGSGVLNFAQGAFGLAGGLIYYHFRFESHWGFWPSCVVAVLGVSLIGAAVHLLPMRRLENAANVARMIATLGVLLTIEAAATLLFPSTGVFVPAFLPSRRFDVAGGRVGVAQLILFGVAAFLTLGLWLFFRYTSIGLATRAVATNPVAAAAQGWSPRALGTFNWMLGSGVGAIAGVLLAPLTGLVAVETPLTVIVAIVAALLGNFTSFPLTMLGAVALAVGEVMIQGYSTIQGLSDALPLAVLVVVLVIRGRGLPLRSHVHERFSEVGSGRVRPVPLGLALAISIAIVVFVLNADVVTSLTTSLTYALVMLSVVVLSGYTGQLSVAQMALAGVGAVISGRLVADLGWPFEISMLVAVIGTMLVGLVFAVPALRTRGVTLAAVSMAAGLAAYSMIFSSITYTGGYAGTNVAGQTFFGIKVDPVLHPRSYAVLVLVMFVIVALVLSNIRRGRVGRRLLAVRTNERAAAALGISVVEAKFYAFAVSAAIAGLGGVLFAFQNDTIIWTNFTPFNSILVIAYAVIGGVGFLMGPIFGSLLVAGGITAFIVGRELSNFGNWLALVGGIGVIINLIVAPNGIAEQTLRHSTELIRKKWPKWRQPRAAPPLVPGERRKIEGTTLEVKDLVVRFGGVTAVDGVSLSIRTGQIVGLIGPNGAGKTTLIDAVTGFVRPAGGEILLGGKSIMGWSVPRRSRAGISRSFQSLELFEDMSVGENLRSASEPRDKTSYLINLLVARNPPFGPEVVAAINEFSLAEVLDRRPGEISYGQRRLVAAARAVAVGPSILLLDEPAAGLSDLETSELRHLVRRLAAEWGMGVLLIEHDVAFVMDVCDEITVLDFGEQIAQGPPESVRGDPAVIAAYLGETLAESETRVAVE
jgi:sulfate-transporting ATPase